MKSKSFGTIEIVNDVTVKTGNRMFDEWFSRDGGIVPGSIVFVTGNSGAGKTTLMLNLMNWLKGHKSSLYSREMSLGAVKQQVQGLEFDNPNASFADHNDCSNVEEYIKELDAVKPSFVIVDSLQAIAEQDYPEIGVEKASVMVRNMIEKWCKANNATLFLIGHNTKDNEFAGKNTNMQMVDAHMVLEYDKKTGIRKIYWGKKNRKGPMGELNYTIENGNIEFYKNTEEVSFIEDFQVFATSYLKKFDQGSENFKNFKKEMNKMSTEVYEKYEGNEYQYMMEFLPRFYKMLSHYDLA
jgi:predicted ATP-dependent serine protease